MSAPDRSGPIRQPHGILADDLTGACDVAGRLVALGYRSIVVLRPISAAALRKLPAADVVVVNTRSRSATPERASEFAIAAARSLTRAGWNVVYLKMDSTLRGHWAREVLSLEEVLRPARVVICPAFPARGRVFQNGRLHLAPSRPQNHRESQNLQYRLKAELGFPPRLIRLGTVKLGAAAIREAIKSAENRFIVLDATKERELAAIGRAFAHSTETILWVGSAGLARHVFPRRVREVPLPVRPSPRPWLLIQGSMKAISHEQFARLRGYAAVHSVLVQPDSTVQEIRASIVEVSKAVETGRSILVSAPREFSETFPPMFERYIAVLLRCCGHGRQLGGILACGGSTAEAVCDSLRARTLRIEREVRPGIPRGVLLDGQCPGLALITKAGGFGGPNEALNVFREVIG